MHCLVTARAFLFVRARIRGKNFLTKTHNIVPGKKLTRKISRTISKKTLEQKSCWKKSLAKNIWEKIPEENPRKKLLSKKLKQK